MNNQQHDIPQEIRHKVITTVDRQELEFLDKIGKDALFSTGHKLSYTEILRALIDFANEVGVTGKDIATVEDLKERLKQQQNDHQE